jgi:hypothetical protein
VGELRVAEVDRELGRVIAAADGTLEEVRAKLAAIGPARAGRLILDEIAWRCRLHPGPAVPTDVGVELYLGGETQAYTVTLGGSGTQLREGPTNDAPARLRQDLGEIARTVFGAGNPSGDATREIWIMNEPGPASDAPDDPWLVDLRNATLAAGQVVEACSAPPPDIGRLARRFGSDKWGDHLYGDHYDRYIAPFRDQRVRVLEIGIGGFGDTSRGGESLSMWKAYFRRGFVVGIDIFDKSSLDEPRLRTVVADQSEPEDLREVSAAFGPFDLIIDDGSHLSRHVITSFQTLFPLLADGGIYVIEDLHTAYWPGWNGGREDPADPTTATGFLKTLVDALHHQDLMPGQSLVPPRTLADQLRAMHVHHNIAFLEKGVNAEQAAPSWVRRHLSAMDLEPAGSMRRIDGGEI